MLPDPRSIEAQHLVLTVRPKEGLSPRQLKDWERNAKRTLIQLSGRSGVLARGYAFDFYLVGLYGSISDAG